jgi:thiamine transporter ThiT
VPRRRWLFVLVLSVPILADLFSSVFLRSEFRRQLLPEFYYAGIVIAGLELGWKAGLAAGILSGIFHPAIGGLFWGGPVTRLEAQLLAFLGVGFALIQQRGHGAGTRNPLRGSAVESAGQGVRGEDYLEQASPMASELRGPDAL